MSIPKEPEKAILFTGLLFGSDADLLRAEGSIKKEFGPFADESQVFNWSHSHYYEDELGSDIKRKFIIFDKLIGPETIADIKLTTNRIEQKLSKDNKRTVNIDPGYITMAKLVLATTKNYCHRIYLGKGIYAEVTLYFREDDFHSTPFTFNDFKQREYIEFFKKARQYLKNKS